jgi:hypothetical protein
VSLHNTARIQNNRYFTLTQDYKHAHKNESILCLTSTKLSEVVELSVQELIDETVSIITSPMQTKHTSSTTLQEHPTDTRSD